jgi:hypothetical protein
MYRLREHRAKSAPKRTIRWRWALAIAAAFWLLVIVGAAIWLEFGAEKLEGCADPHNWNGCPR